MPTQQEKAEQLLKLHDVGGSLLLPNAWDSASARLFEQAGFPAIATTSSGVAFANGYGDGQQISRDEMLAIIKRITAAVNIPVTADVEAGYGPTPEDVAITVRGVIQAGAVGINLEDNTGYGNPLYAIDDQVKRIAAGREAADQAGIPLVINARTDTYLYQIGAAETRMQDTLDRAKAYLDAGASSIFVPGVLDRVTIEQLVNGIAGPVNVLVGPGAPSAPELFSWGVRRISVGGSVMQATMGLVRAIASELRQTGTYEKIGQYALTHAQAQQLMTQKK